MQRFQNLSPALEVSARARHVWMVIHMAQYPNGVSIGYSQLSNMTGWSRKSVQRAVSELVDAKLLKIVKRGGIRDLNDGTKRNEASVYKTQLPS